MPESTVTSTSSPSSGRRDATADMEMGKTDNTQAAAEASSSAVSEHTVTIWLGPSASTENPIQQQAQRQQQGHEMVIATSETVAGDSCKKQCCKSGNSCAVVAVSPAPDCNSVTSTDSGKESPKKSGCGAGDRCDEGTKEPCTKQAAASSLSPDLLSFWCRLSLSLAWFSVIWNLGELIAGFIISIGFEQIQLVLLANAGQSGCEIVSALLVMWRLKLEVGPNDAASTAASPTDTSVPAERARQDLVERERRGIRFMGWMFVVLSLAVIGGCIARFIAENGPDNTLPGLIDSITTSVAMVILWRVKIRASTVLDSKTLLEDARCSLYCFKLSVVVIIGSVISLVQDQISDHCTVAFCNFWWLDAVLACLLSVFIFKDGVQAIRMSYDEAFQGGACGCCAGEAKPLACAFIPVSNEGVTCAGTSCNGGLCDGGGGTTCGSSRSALKTSPSESCGSKGACCSTASSSPCATGTNCCDKEKIAVTCAGVSAAAASDCRDGSCAGSGCTSFEVKKSDCAGSACKPTDSCCSTRGSSPCTAGSSTCSGKEKPSGTCSAGTAAADGCCQVPASSRECGTSPCGSKQSTCCETRTTASDSSATSTCGSTEEGPKADCRTNCSQSSCSTVQLTSVAITESCSSSSASSSSSTSPATSTCCSSTSSSSCYSSLMPAASSSSSSSSSSASSSSSSCCSATSSSAGCCATSNRAEPVAASSYIAAPPTGCSSNCTPSAVSSPCLPDPHCSNTAAACPRMSIQQSAEHSQPLPASSCCSNITTSGSSQTTSTCCNGSTETPAACEPLFDVDEDLDVYAD